MTLNQIGIITPGAQIERDNIISFTVSSETKISLLNRNIVRNPGPKMEKKKVATPAAELESIFFMSLVMLIQFLANAAINGGF